MIPVRELCELASNTKAFEVFTSGNGSAGVYTRDFHRLIVIGHFQCFCNIGRLRRDEGLVYVSGISLARFQLQAINERGNVRTLVKSVVSIAAPTILYTVLVQVLFDTVHWQTVLLISNWYSPNVIGNFVYWYIEVLVQMLVIIGFALSFERVRNIISADPFRCLVIAACVLAVADVLISRYVFDASALFNQGATALPCDHGARNGHSHASSTTQKWIVSSLPSWWWVGRTCWRCLDSDRSPPRYGIISMSPCLPLSW